METLLLDSFLLALGALVGVAIGRSLELPGGVSAFLGGLLGPVGWAILWLGDGRPRCEWCLGRIPTGPVFARIAAERLPPVRKRYRACNKERWREYKKRWRNPLLR